MFHPAELDRLRVVLVSSRNPLNIGAAARAMSNFGFSHLRVVTPYEVAFRDARSAVGAAALLANAEEYSSLSAAVADCSLVVGTTAVGRRGLNHPLQRLEAGALLIRSQLANTTPELSPHSTPPSSLPSLLEDPPESSSGTGNVALLFGSEKRGLSNEDLSHCHWLMHIPTHTENISMNLGQAVAVCLYEIIRENEASPMRTAASRPAASEELERVATILTDALLISGYMDEERRVSTAQIVRRLVRRMELSGSDAELLLGMLRQVLWKARRNATPKSGC